MSGEKFKFRRAQVGVPIPANEPPSVGEPFHDIDKGAIAVACGEPAPRWLPGVDIDGALRLQSGQKIKSNDGRVVLSAEGGFFTVLIDGDEALKISEDGEAYVSSFQLTDTLRFPNLETVNYGTVPGFSYKNGVFSITAELELLGGLNLSLSDFAAGILPTTYNPNDILVAGEGNASTHKWKSADALITGLSKLAPLLYRTANRNTNTLDLALDAIPSLFGVNENKNGLLTDDLRYFTSTFGGVYGRGSSATYYNRAGKLISADINEPRYDFEPYTGRARGLLIEAYSRNLMPNSNMLSATTGSNLSAVQISRDLWTSKNFRNPWAVTEAGNAEHSREVLNPITLNKTYAFSTLVELPVSNGTVRCQLSLSYLGNSSAVKFLVNSTGAGSVESLNTGTGNVISVFSERISATIYRIGFAGILDTNSAASVNGKFKFSTLNSANQVVFNSSASDVCYIGEWQIEPSDRVTSLIPTFGSPLDRAADVFALNFNQSFNFSGNNDVLSLKFMSRLYTAGDPIVTLKNNASDYSTRLEALSNTSIVLKKGSTSSFTSLVTADIDNDFTIYDVDVTGNSQDTTAYIGSNAAQTKFFQGWINNIRLYR